MNLLKNMFLIFGLLVFISRNNVNAQLNSNLMPVASIDREISIPNYEPLSLMEKDKCAKYKKMKGIGMGLMIGGVVLFFGTLLLAEKHEYGNPGYGTIDSPYSDDAGTLIIIGMAGIGSGIPLTIIGSKKSKQYCNQKTSSLNLVPTQKGAGLQLSF